MGKMHEGELEINESLVRRLLKIQAQDLADLPLIPLISSGTDHALFRLGEEYSLRLPRILGCEEDIGKEYTWLPILASSLNIPISEPIFKGNPEKFYPCPWIIMKWKEGTVPDFEKDGEHKYLAKDLAEFLNELRKVKQSGSEPGSRRGGLLIERDSEVKKAISELEGEVDSGYISFLWEKLSKIPYSPKEISWIHGDLLPGNILISEGRLSAVIDFSITGLGDPATDLIIAWSLFNKNSRETFRDNLLYINENMWERGKGRALSIALTILPYYKNTNPALCAVARKIIENILS